MKHSRRGFILFVVFVVVAMLALAGYGFSEWMVLERKAVALFGDGLQAEHAAASGEAFIVSRLMEPIDITSGRGELVDNSGLFRGIALHDGPGPRARFSVVSTSWGEDGESTVHFGLQNESARLNLASLIDWDRAAPDQARAALMHLPNMSEDTADALLDWLDEDSVPRELGAENDYYESLPRPYRPRNGLPSAIEELLLVRGVTPQLLLGRAADDAPRGGTDSLNPAETSPRHDRSAATRPRTQQGSPPAGVSAGRFQSDEPPIPWAELLTIHSGERNQQPDGKPKIHLNAPELGKLHAALVSALDTEYADFVIAYRQHGPYSGQPDPGPRVIPRVDLTVPPRFVLESELDLVDAKVRFPSTGSQPSAVLESPLTSDRFALQEQLPKWLDHVSVTDQSVLRCRIHLRDAHPLVLESIPGMDEGIVQRIVAVRQSQSPDGAAGSPRRHATWILAEGIVDLQRMKILLPRLTMGGDVFRGEIIGFSDLAGPTARREIVVDATGDTPRRVYYKNLIFQGTGYSLQELGADDVAIHAEDDRQEPQPSGPAKK